MSARRPAEQSGPVERSDPVRWEAEYVDALIDDPGGEHPRPAGIGPSVGVGGDELIDKGLTPVRWLGGGDPSRGGAGSRPPGIPDTRRTAKGNTAYIDASPRRRGQPTSGGSTVRQRG